MRLLITRHLFVCIALAWLMAIKSSFGQPVVAGPDRLIDPPTRTQISQALCRQLTKQYIFPKVAHLIEQTIQAQLTAGNFASITSSKAFADTLTAQMLRISKDKHVRLFYHDKPGSSAGGESTAGEQSAMIQYARQINYGFGKPEILAGNIGYLQIDEFMPVELAAPTALAAMNFLSQTDGLLLDLRHNRGGEPAMVAYMASFFFGPDAVHLNDLISKGGNSVQAFWTNPHIPGNRYTGKPLYILTSKKTFSAGEEFAYDLQSLKRAVVVGEPTAGGAHSGELVRIGDHFKAFIPTEYARNPITQTNWEGTGVIPNQVTSAGQAQKKAYLSALDELISRASGTRKKRWLRMIRTQAAAAN